MFTNISKMAQARQSTNGGHICIRQVTKEIFDVFFNDEWYDWSRVKWDGNRTTVIGGRSLDHNERHFVGVRLVSFLKGK